MYKKSKECTILNYSLIFPIICSDDGTSSQIFVRNGIFDNNATALRESTIKISQGRPKFMKNFLVNSLNDFEMMTYPKTE